LFLNFWEGFDEGGVGVSWDSNFFLGFNRNLFIVNGFSYLTRNPSTQQ